MEILKRAIFEDANTFFIINLIYWDTIRIKIFVLILTVLKNLTTCYKIVNKCTLITFIADLFYFIKKGVLQNSHYI